MRLTPGDVVAARLADGYTPERAESLREQMTMTAYFPHLVPLWLPQLRTPISHEELDPA